MTKRKKVYEIKWKQVSLALIILFVGLSLLTVLPNLGKNPTPLGIIVQVAVCALFVVGLGIYMYFADVANMVRTRKITATCLAILISYGMLSLGSSVWEYGTNIVPLAMCSLIVTLIVSPRTGFFANFMVIALYIVQVLNFNGIDMFENDVFFYLLLSGFISSIVASFVLGRNNNRFAYVVVGAILGLVDAVCNSASYLLFVESAKQSFDVAVFFTEIGLSFASGIIGIMLMFLIVPLFERLFNVVTVFRFAEIANSSTPLMKLMFEKAPGTYNHSMTVAVYVEACATAIGENAMLARACAYYHDIGKLKSPTYFTENQLDGVNPHDGMTPEASVNMIRSHVSNGLAMAKEYNLPVEVTDAIAEHHGTMPIKYFYLKAKKYTDGELGYEDYSYAGPKPTNKISAILMICDACEAALRATQDKSKTETVVDNIVSERMAFDQFSDCNITMKEIDIIKSTIITTFLGIKHKRVKYPEVKLEE